MAPWGAVSNHFIELGKSNKTDDYWLTIHSGSRNFGKCIADYHQKKAVRIQNTPSMSKEDYVNEVKAKYESKYWAEEIAKYNIKHTHKQSPKGMEYLQGEDMFDYLVDMIIAQTYADFNRKVMMDEILKVLSELGTEYPDFGEEIITIHNFIDFDDWIIRKGAIRSYVGEKAVIPFNPKTGLIICEGKSSPEWNYSAPHGAGRLFSRSDAKRKISKEDAEKAMEGVYASVKPLDESPLAYKDAEIIEICIEPTVHILDRVISIMNLKAS